MPAVLGHKLLLTAFNAGIDGQDFLYAMMLFDLWQRSNAPPEAIVLNVDSDSFEKADDELQRASVFSFYYDDSPLVRRIPALVRGHPRELHRRRDLDLGPIRRLQGQVPFGHLEGRLLRLAREVG